MSLLESLFKQLTGILTQSGAANNAGLMNSLGILLGGSKSGGLAALINAFKEKGLGDAVSSWIGTGENKAITPEQVQSVLGLGKIEEIASKLGLTVGQASSGLAGLIPQLIDKLSPTGKLPEDHVIEDALSKLAKGESETV